MLFWLCATQRLFLSISGTSVHDCMDVWLLEYQHFGLSRRDQKEVNNIKITKKQVGKKTKMVIIFALLRLHFFYFTKMPGYCIWAFMTYICLYIYMQCIHFILSRLALVLFNRIYKGFVKRCFFSPVKCDSFQ